MILSRVNGTIVLTTSPEETDVIEEIIAKSNEAEVVILLSQQVQGWINSKKELKAKDFIKSYDKLDSNKKAQIDDLLKEKA